MSRVWFAPWLNSAKTRVWRTGRPSKNTTIRAEDPGTGDHLRWRLERSGSNASIRQIRPRYVSGHKASDLRWSGTLGGGAISWFSRAQATTAEETSEAEYEAMSEIVKEILFFWQVQAFIVTALESNPVDIVEDNQGAIKMGNNRHSSKQTRHIDIIRDAIDEGKVRVTYVKTEYQHADVLTKPLDRRMFDKHANALMDVN